MEYFTRSASKNKTPVEQLQRRMISDALRECDGNRTQAAIRLGMHRPNLIRLMNRLGIEDAER